MAQVAHCTPPAQIRLCTLSAMFLLRILPATKAPCTPPALLHIALHIPPAKINILAKFLPSNSASNGEAGPTVDLAQYAGKIPQGANPPIARPNLDLESMGAAARFAAANSNAKSQHSEYLWPTSHLLVRSQRSCWPHYQTWISLELLKPTSVHYQLSR